MARYISLKDIENTGLVFCGTNTKYIEGQSDGANQMWDKIRALPPADVIERNKIDKAIKEIKDNSFKTIVPQYSCLGDVIGVNEVLNILKENIGE